MKAMISWCSLPIKGMQVSARPAAAKETSIDAGTVTVLSDGGGIFTLKVKQIIGSGQHVFTTNWLCQEFC